MLKFILSGCLTLIGLTLAAQTYTSTNKKAIKLYEEGKSYFDRQMLDNAIEAYEKAVKADSQFVEAFIMLAESYNEKRDPNKAVYYYNRSFRANPDFFPANYLWVAVLENSLGMYEQAKLHAEKYLSYPQSRDEKRRVLAEQTIKGAAFAIHAIKNPVPFNPVNLGPEVNSPHNEYFPAITADDQVLMFTRQIPDDRVRGGQQEDFYMAVRDANGKWGKSFNMGSPINTISNEGAPTLSADGQIIIFTACEYAPGEYGPNRKGYGSCDLFYSRRTGSKWSAPVNLGKPLNTPAWETQPSYSADGTSLYFVRGSGRGSSRNGDIYYSYINEEGYWTEPVKLSDKINTPYEEQSVFIHPDGQTLYFSSAGHIGMGGFDIFMSKRQPDGEWGLPVNLGYPINTAGDENSLLVSADGKIGYFASDREGGSGGLDLYSFELPQNVRPEQVAYLKGKIYDAETKKPLEARFELIDLKTGKTAVQSYSDASTGEFLVVLPSGRDYALNATAENYLFYSENFQMGEGSEARPYRRDVPLAPVKEGQTIVLRNVFFNTASAELREESKVELNRLVAFLNSNPGIKIEISGHTDNVGDDKSNQILSENRAKSVYDYVVKNGIQAERMTYRGYGETKPIATNDTDEGRQLNRRTEVKVTGK